MQKKMQKKFWYAVGGNGQSCVFATVPIRDEKRRIWLGEVVGCVNTFMMYLEGIGLEFPPLSWLDEPWEFSLTVDFN